MEEKKIIKEVLGVKVSVDPNNKGATTLDIDVICEPLSDKEGAKPERKRIRYIDMKLKDMSFDLDKGGTLSLFCQDNNTTITIDRMHHLETISF